MWNAVTVSQTFLSGSFSQQKQMPEAVTASGISSPLLLSCYPPSLWERGKGERLYYTIP